MENKSTERFGMPAEFTLTPENDRVRVKFLEKNTAAELSSDYTLPDYLPEIRKILGIYPRISPLSRYFGNSIEFSGRIDYDLVYCTSEGELTSVPLGEDFSFEVEPEAPSGIDFSSSGDAFADVRVDSLHIRATAPRKVNVKCRLHALVRAYGYDETAAGTSDTSNTEALISEPVCAGLYRSMSEVIELSDEIPIQGGTANLRPILSRGNVNVTDISQGENRLNCRGEVITEILGENRETGEISTITKKIPFTHELELSEENTGELLYYSVKGKCNEIKLLDSEDKFLIDTEVILEADTASSAAVNVTEDIFIPGRESSVSYRDFKYESLLCSGSGKVSVSESIPLSELSIAEGGEIIDRSATVRVDGLSQNASSGIIGGSLKLRVLSRNGGEYSSGEVSLPFSLDTGTDIDNKKISLCAAPTVTSLNCRSDGGKAVCEADITVSYCLMSEESIRIAESVKASDEVAASPSGITVYYPEKGDTLWSVAKKFGTPLKNIAEMNSLSTFKGIEDISSKQFIMIY